jgi:cellulose synthase/poly-beta-1,6-N-acetylglucosamine synthase-like glycosyltransferase
MALVPGVQSETQCSGLLTHTIRPPHLHNEGAGKPWAIVKNPFTEEKHVQMMEAFLLISMILGIFLPYGLYLAGRDHVRRGLTGRTGTDGLADKPFASNLPCVGIVVPLTGSTSTMRACLESLLGQSYPDYQVIFVTCGPDDPASQIVSELISERKNARHVFSGEASRCSQKNHNLLAGVSALGTSAEILTFCDSTHMAPQHFLADLVSPIIQGEAFMTTGFHRVTPGDMRLPTLGMLVSVMSIHLMQAITAITQPWGGATAISRQTFEDNEIGSLWATNFVDDLSMGTLLAKAGIRVKPVSSACLLTPLSGVTLRGWHGWLKRQLFFLKFCQPGVWIASALAAYLFAAPLLAGLAFSAGLLGIASKTVAISGFFCLVAFCALGLKWRTLTQEKIPAWRWISAFFAGGLMAVVCYAGTWAGNILPWRGISYRVSWGGKVEEVIRSR